MVSYKKMYLEMKEKYENQVLALGIVVKSDFLCPLCESPLMEAYTEIFCSDESCKYDLTITDLIEKLDLKRS